MNSPFVVIVAVLLLARVGLRQAVPMTAFYVAGGAWALDILWSPVTDWLAWGLAFVDLGNRYQETAPFTALLDHTVAAVLQLPLVPAVILAANGTAIAAAPEPAAAPPLNAPPPPPAPKAPDAAALPPAPPIG